MDSKRVKIEIGTKTFIRFCLVAIGFTIVGVFLYKITGALIILGAALFLAIALNPAVKKLSNLFRTKSRSLGAAIAYVIIVVVIGVVLGLVVPLIIDQSVKLVQNIPSVVESSSSTWQVVDNFAEQNDLQNVRDGILDSLNNFSVSFANDFSVNIINSASSVFYAIGMVIITLVLAFLMLVQGPDIIDGLWHQFSDKKYASKAKRIVNKMAATISNFTNGQLLVALSDGLFVAVGLTIVCLIFPDLPFNIILPLALLDAVLALIPMFGAIISCCVIALLLLFTSPIAALVFILYFIIYQQIQGNIIATLIQSKSSKLPALVVLSAITVGTYLFGLLGAIIAIPVAGCIKVLIEELPDPKPKTAPAIDKTV